MLRCVLLFALCLSALVSGYPPSSYPIDWASVPSTPPQPRNYNSPYIGDCICDVTWGLCDPNCCCDSDCSDETKKLFDYCLPETVWYPDIDYCYDPNRATEIKRINHNPNVYIDSARTGLEVRIDKRRQAYSAVCVIRTNHPSDLYRFFKVPATSSVRAPHAVTGPSPTDSQSHQNYTVKDMIPLFKYDVSGAEAQKYRNIGAVQTPSQASDGACSPYGVNVGFLSPVTGVSCTVTGASACSLFPVSRFTNLFLSRFGSPSDVSDPVPVTIRILSGDGAELAVLDPTQAVDEALLSRIEGSSCINGVYEVKTTIGYNASTTGKITSATVTLKVKQMAVDSTFPFVSEAIFVPDGEVPPSNVISGTPGYLSGYRVRAGVLVTRDGKSAIQEAVNGFATPGGGKACDLNNYARVAFMQSVVSSGCYTVTSDEELQAMCTTGTRNTLSAALNVSGNFMDYVAVTNDALTNDTTSWIPISGLDSVLGFAERNGTYDAVRRTCSDIVVGVSYKFVIAYAGLEFNPQNVIVGAFAEPIWGTWRIANTSDFSAAAATRQQLRFRATFWRHNEDSQETIRRKVKAPPILPRLDDSIFYPFRKPYPL